MKVFTLLICFTLAIVEALENNADPVVHSPAGIFKGSILKSQLRKDIYSFRGIRYADAPTGPNRFKAAQLAKPHNGIFEATSDGPVCPQPLSNQPIAEDCLNLNVYTTKLPSNSTGNSSQDEISRPVLVFIHSGGFVSSSGSSYDLGPQYMLMKDMILVTFNYRLGALGFLSTGDSRAPGNAGLKDQVLALRWIQQNIKSFGGNPNSVTLMGHVAGAWSISLHMVSPMSKGLFHRTILMSGAATTQKPLPTDQKDLAKKQAQVLGCPIDTLDNMFNCLYTKSSEEFGNSISNLTDLNIYSWPIFSPVIEQTNVENDNDEERFLTAQPDEIIRKKKANFVPFIIGFDKYDFSTIKISNSDPASMNEFNRKWEEIAPSLFGYDKNPRSSYISKELKSFYFKNESIGLENYPKLGELYDDAYTIFPSHRFERLMVSHSTEPVHIYYDIYKGCDGFPRWSNGTHFSPPHYDEMLLNFKIGDHPDLCEQDAMKITDIGEFIFNLMETGYPIPESKANNYPIKWESPTENHPWYMEFGADIRMVDEFVYQERMNKWDELFPIEPVQHSGNCAASSASVNSSSHS